MSIMKVAVIGCGMIASSQHIPSYTKNPNAEIKYLIDIDRKRAEVLAETYSIPHISDDFRTMLADTEVEAVSICTPNASHAEIAIACLNAGKHVLCEKPASVTLDLVRDMRTAADTNNRILNIGMVNRFSTAVNKIKEMIEAGELGNVYHIYCSFRAHRSIPGLGGPFTTKALSGGGVLIDWGVHFLDLIFYSLGQLQVNSVSGAVYSEMAKQLEAYVYKEMWAGPPNLIGTCDVKIS